MDEDQEVEVTCVVRRTFTIHMELNEEECSKMRHGINLVNDMMPEPIESLVALQEAIDTARTTYR